MSSMWASWLFAGLALSPGKGWGVSGTQRFTLENTYANAPALCGLATFKPSAWVFRGDFKQDSVDKHLIYNQPHRNQFLTTSRLKCSSSFPSHQSKHQSSGAHINSSFSALSSPTFPLLTPAPGPLHLQFPLLQMILFPKISKVHSLTSVRCSLNAGLSADLS